MIMATTFPIITTSSSVNHISDYIDFIFWQRQLRSLSIFFGWPPTTPPPPTHDVYKTAAARYRFDSKLFAPRRSMTLGSQICEAGSPSCYRHIHVDHHHPPRLFQAPFFPPVCFVVFVWFVVCLFVLACFYLFARLFVILFCVLFVCACLYVCAVPFCFLFLAFDCLC